MKRFQRWLQKKALQEFMRGGNGRLDWSLSWQTLYTALYPNDPPYSIDQVECNERGNITKITYVEHKNHPDVVEAVQKATKEILAMDDDELRRTLD